LCDRRGHGCVL
nr:immunoglobulin heavy chain junction region [Homo sapiens]